MPLYPPAGSGGGAPTTSQYVTLATDAGLSNERVLTAGNDITLTDAGAGSTITVARTMKEALAFVSADVIHATTDTTLSNITGLLVAIGSSATEIWYFDAILLAQSNGAAADFKYGWTVPASCTMKWLNMDDIGVAIGVAASAVATESGTLSAGGSNLTTIQRYCGMIFGGGTSGNVQMQFAQNTSSANTTNILKGSTLRAVRLTP